MSDLGTRIKARRQALGWTLDRLANEARVSKGYLSDLENSVQKEPSSAHINRVATALGVTLDHLISGAPIENPDEKIEIPASLVAFAESENLTFAQTRMILRLRRQLVAFRNEGGKDDFDWKPFYEAVKPYLK